MHLNILLPMVELHPLVLFENVGDDRILPTAMGPSRQGIKQDNMHFDMGRPS
jgi:hypothetical protein